VIVPAQTYIATAIAVRNVGAVPVFGDVESDTHCLAPGSVEALRSPRTRAVLLVHYGGLISPRLEEILGLCKRHGLKLVEDAAHAHGAARQGRPAGSLGEAASFSYYATKVLTTGEGGMVTTNDQKVVRLARMYQARGMDLTRPDEELFVLPVHNVRMTELAALCGVVQHRRLEEFLTRRREIADVYARFFESKHPEIEFQRCPPDTRHAYWKFTVNLPKGIDRAALQTRLKQEWNVSANWSYFPPLHLQPVFRELYGTREGQCPVAEDVCARCFNLPMHVRLTTEDAETVCEAFEAVYKSLS
jgi:dTDP-4-amino-4,6-dideoxygalactose transaminase